MLSIHCPVFLGRCRPGILVWWLLQPACWQSVFANMSFLIPLLGFVFVPWTTIMYVLVFAGGVTGFDWVWLGLGLLADIAWWSGVAVWAACSWGYTGQRSGPRRPYLAWSSHAHVRLTCGWRVSGACLLWGKSSPIMSHYGHYGA